MYGYFAYSQVLGISSNCTVVGILFAYYRWINMVLFQVSAAFIGERCKLVILLFLRLVIEYLWNFVCLPRATVCADRICSFWGSAGLPEKEPWIKWYLLQRPGYQTTNKSDRTAADEVCLANRWWNVLFVIDTSEWCNFSLNDVLIDKASFVT